MNKAVLMDEITKASEARTMEPEHRLIEDRKKKLAELRASGVEPYPHAFVPSAKAAAILKKHKGLKPESETKEQVTIAGRIVLLRKMGKMSFCQVQDGSGRIQVLTRKDDVSDENYALFKKFDIGDFIGVTGAVITTKTGEITVRAENTTLLCKSVRPLPEKFHGLKDTEVRYRKRYLDLMTNEQSRSTFVARTKIISTMRRFFDEKEFLEVETPTIQPIYGGANARPFITHHNALDMRLYMRISDELYLKRLIVGGFERVYEICKDFRNEGVDTSHNPEFTMIEWYQAYGDYDTGMKMTEELIANCVKAVNGTTKVTYQGKELDFTTPWKRAKMTDLIKEHAGIDVLPMKEAELHAYCKQEHIEVEANATWGVLVQHIFEEKCEEHLWQPTFVIDHPIETTPLCKPMRDGDARLVERFEAFIAGMECSNGYTELNDPILQRKLLMDQNELRMTGDDEAHPMDEDFAEAIEYGMPPTSGVGVGVDRVVMLATDSASIRDVIFFPTMRPEENENDKKKTKSKKGKK